MRHRPRAPCPRVHPTARTVRRVGTARNSLPQTPSTSGALAHPTNGRSPQLRLERGRPQRVVGDIAQGHRHHLGGAVDGDVAEELQPIAGRQVLPLRLGRRFDVDLLRAERLVERVRAKRAGMDRPRHEFPEWLEVLERRLVRIVIVRGGVVHVGGEPYGVAHAGMLDEREEIGDLELAPARGAVVALCDRLDAPLPISVVDHHQADRHVGGDHLPGRPRVHQLALEPGHLRGPEEIGGRPVLLLHALGIGAAVAAHVEHEHVEQRAVGDLAIDAAGLRLALPHRHVFMERPAGAGREQQCVLLAVLLAQQLRTRDRFARPPVVQHLVIVPLREDRDLGVEREHVLVEQIVFVVAAEFGERLGRLGLVLGDDVLPDLAVGHLLLGDDRAVGVDVVAAVDEEVGSMA